MIAEWRGAGRGQSFALGAFRGSAPSNPGECPNVKNSVLARRFCLAARRDPSVSLRRLVRTGDRPGRPRSLRRPSSRAARKGRSGPLSAPPWSGAVSSGRPSAHGASHRSPRGSCAADAGPSTNPLSGGILSRHPADQGGSMKSVLRILGLSVLLLVPFTAAHAQAPTVSLISDVTV